MIQLIYSNHSNGKIIFFNILVKEKPAKCWLNFITSQKTLIQSNQTNAESAVIAPIARNAL